MKNILLVTLISFLFLPLFSQTTDVVTKKEFQDAKKNLSQNIDQAKKTGFDAKRIALKQAETIDSLKAVVRVSQAMVKENEDSLAAANAKISTFQERLDQNKMSARNYIIITLVVFGILFVIAFMMLLTMKSRFDKKTAGLEEQNGKLESDVSGLKEVNHMEHEKISSVAEDLEKKLIEAIEKEDLKHKELAGQISDLLKSLNEKSQALVAAMEDLKSEHGKKLLQHDQRVKEIDSALDTKIKEVEKRVLPVVEKQKEVSGALADEIKLFRNSIEREIKKISEEFAAHIHTK